MNSVAFPTTPPGGVVFGLIQGLAGAGQRAQAPDEHADRPLVGRVSHTVGGVGVRLLCPLTSLLGRVVGVCSPAARFDWVVSL